MDAVHKRNGEEGSPSVPPRREDITDTMIFSPSDLVTMICRDVDLNYATRGTNKFVRICLADFTCFSCREVEEKIRGSTACSVVILIF